MLAVEKPNLEGLWDELHRGRVFECRLRDPKWHLDGLQSGQDVYIDPRPSILDSLIHELIHRRHPRLGERTVRRMTSKLISGMSEADMLKWWKAYGRIKKKSRTVEYEPD